MKNRNFDQSLALDSDASVSDQELGASFGCDRKCDLGLKWFNPQFTRGMTRAGPNDIYAAVVMDYFNHLRPGPEDGTLEQAEGCYIIHVLYHI